MEYVVFYDILESKSGAEFATVAFLLGILLGVFFLRRAIKKKNNTEIIFSVIWLAGWLQTGLIGFGSVYFQHFRCAQWARSGNYQIIEGPIVDFKEYTKIEKEQFSVGNVHFEYSPYDLSVCGFRQIASEGSPVRDGLQVRIAYKDGKILKLEIAKSQ